MTTVFTLATRALCCKADIPEVEAIKRLLFSPLRGALEALGEQMLVEIDARLDELETTVGAPDVNLLAEGENRAETMRQLMASILLAFTSGETVFLPAPIGAVIRSAANALLDMGADEIGVPRDYPGRGLVHTGLVGELRAMILHLVRDRRVDVENAVRFFLTSATPRTEKSEILLSGLPESELPRSKEEFDLLLALLLLTPGAAEPDPEGERLVDRRVDTTLDIWAYSAFVAAEVEAGRAAGITEFRAVAVIDGGTTAFCRWVNGRRIPTAAIDRELRRRRDAVARGDGGALARGRRFLSPETARGGTTRQFASFFRAAGLPPYHLGCRTIVRAVRG